MDSIVRTERTTLHRRPQRGTYERAALNAILDEALICHVGFVAQGQPFVTPTIHTRIGEQLYLHGSIASRMQKSLAGGIPVCVTVTLVDALVLARSAFHHSMNYRSAMILGAARAVTDIEERRRAFEALVNHVVPGRAPHVRAPNEQELKATSLLVMPITEASAKIRVGQPSDLEPDYALPCWAGLIPLQVQALAPVPDPRLTPGIPTPPELIAYSRTRHHE